ncbi:MAG: CDP-glycerol glycerophosphotransferase family protein [Winogradskyella sp.]|uniref:CDP-glycerol glycerophosphotransferase family protein n=1 Tax=Winogradskyella sp. TaxID=1883156 RepID=UPI0038591DB9
MKTYIINLLIKFIHFCCPKKGTRIVYSSFPDVADNSFALFVYVLNQHPKYENIWLVSSLKDELKLRALINTYSNSTNYKLVKKMSITGFYYYFTSKFVFYTHGLFNAFPLSSKQTVVNLWHGMPLKVIGLLDGKSTFLKSDYVIATSTLFQNIMSRACGVKTENVLVTGQPRNEFLLNPKTTLNTLFAHKDAQNRQTVLWMPTYRKSDFGEVREDGDSFNDDLMSEQRLDLLNTFLVKAEANCFIKLHPMDINKKDSFKIYSNLVFLDNDSFNESNINMYSCFACVDVLLTDYSSIYMDLLILNKPVGFVISDFKSYQETRGFTLENPLDYMPGEIIYTHKDLLSFLNKSLVLKKDDFSEARLKTNKEFNEVYKNSSERIFNKVIFGDT